MSSGGNLWITMHASSLRIGLITTPVGGFTPVASGRLNAGTTLRLIPFVSPGFGFSRLSDSGDSQTGSRAMLGGGVSLGSQASPLLVTVSARKIFLDGAPTIWGLGFSTAR